MSKKSKIIEDSLGTRLGRRTLAKAMVQPMLRSTVVAAISWHSCDECSFCEACVSGDDIGYDSRKGREGDCWVPRGYLSIWDEVGV